MTKFKKPLLFALCLLPIALVAGIFAGIYQVEMLPEEMVAEAIAEIGSLELLVVITVIQSVVYALVCGFFGYIFANKLGLWRPIRIEKEGLVTTLMISLVGGIIFSLDYWTFGSFIEPVKESYAADITASNVIASVLYGGFVEEVMLRLFFMSLIALILWKLFYKRYDTESTYAEAYSFCTQDLTEKASANQTLKTTAEESAIHMVEALLKPFEPHLEEGQTFQILFEADWEEGQK